MSQNKLGRKVTYTDEDLMAIIREYSMQHIREKVTIAKLVIDSGVSKATWYRSKVATEYIEEINDAPLLMKVKDTSVLTTTEINKLCGEDVLRYREVISQLMEVISEQEKEINQLKQGRSSQEIESVVQLRGHIAEKDKQIKKLNEKINFITASDDKLINIQDNMDRMNRKTFDKQFKELFDDD